MYTPRYPVRSIVIMASALLALFLLSFVMGRYGVPLGQVVRILLSGVLPLEQTWTDNMAIAVLNVRLPRILLACLVGCSLSTAGTAYQSVFRNPMAAPDILGASSGACFGAAQGLDILGLNYASSRYDPDAAKYPDRLMVGAETMAADLPYNWERVKKYPQLVGDFVWSAWDYLGEACMGWTYHSYKGLPLLANQGMIDITGKPLASMYFMQIVWGLRKEPFIGVRPLNHAKEAPSTGAWQFTNAIDSWSWQGYEGEKAVVPMPSG